MPSGAKKRKAAKKKKVNNNGSSTANPNQGENDSGELNSPTSQDPLAEVVKKEDDSSDNKLKDISEEEQGNIEIEIGSKSKSSNGSSSSSSDSSDDESNVVEKKVVLESVPVIEPIPENVSPIVEPIIKPVDSLLEQVSQVFDEIKDERKGFVVEETPVVAEEQQQTVVISEINLKDDCPSSSEVVESVLKEKEDETLPLLDEKASLEAEECVESSRPPKELIPEVKDAECANEAEPSDIQARVASTPLAVQKTTSWKSCCGIFELFTGSQRN